MKAKDLNAKMIPIFSLEREDRRIEVHLFRQRPLARCRCEFRKLIEFRQELLGQVRRFKVLYFSKRNAEPNLDRARSKLKDARIERH